jgi:hypothetical protein
MVQPILIQTILPLFLLRVVEILPVTRGKSNQPAPLETPGGAALLD